MTSENWKVIREGLVVFGLTVIVVILAMMGLMGCAPVVGTEAMVQQATARDCEPSPLTGDHAADMERHLAELDERGVRIVYRDVGKGATAWPRRLALSPNWHDKSPAQQSALMQHERAHYCDQDDRGVLQFLVDWSTPEGRLVLKVRGAVAQAAGMRQQGATPAEVEAKLRRTFERFTDTYKLELDEEWWWERMFVVALAAAMDEERDR